MPHPVRKAITVHDEREATSYTHGHVSVIDDDQAVRFAISAILRHEGYAVTEFASADDFLAFEERGDPLFPGPKCLLLDVKMPGASGLELQRRLASLCTTWPIVFMSGGSSAAEAVQAMKAGALDFLIKPFDDNALLDAVERALLRSVVVEEASLSTQEASRRYASLSEREAQLARLVSQGLQNQQIASHLTIAERTVKLHKMHMMRKLGASNLVELIRILDRLG